MYPEHEPLHTSRSDDTILSLLGHRLKKFFPFFITFYHTPITFLPNITVKVKPGAHSSETLPLLLKSQAIISALLTGNVTFPLQALAAQTCSPLLLSAKWLPGVWQVIGGHRPSQLDSSTACFSVPLVQRGYLGSFSIPSSRMLNLSGLTTLISGRYLNITFT